MLENVPDSDVYDILFHYLHYFVIKCHLFFFFISELYIFTHIADIIALIIKSDLIPIRFYGECVIFTNVIRTVSCDTKLRMVIFFM